MNRWEFKDWFATVDKDACPEGVYACMEKILVMMFAEGVTFPTAKDVVLNRIETESEVFVVMGLAGWDTDTTEFTHWVRTAKIIGMTQRDCREAVDRGAERGRA